MSLYFIYKFNIVKNTFTLVNHAINDNEAIALMKTEADKYVTAKSRLQFDQTTQSTQTQSQNLITYALRESHKKVNTIDVYQTEIITRKGWISSDVKTNQVKIAQFSVVKYDKSIRCNDCSVSLVDDSKKQNLLHNIKSDNYLQRGFGDKREPTHMDRVLLTELKQNNTFKDRKKYTDNNTLLTFNNLIDDIMEFK